MNVLNGLAFSFEAGIVSTFSPSLFEESSEASNSSLPTSKMKRHRFPSIRQAGFDPENVVPPSIEAPHQRH
jgi:hypothetical protein